MQIKLLYGYGRGAKMGAGSVLGDAMMVAIVVVVVVVVVHEE